MLNLIAKTSPEWVERAVRHVDDVLLDHAHLEKKAAGMAVTLMFRYPEHPALQRSLPRLAREELIHFEQVMGHLDRLGIRFGPQRPSPYAGRLHRAVRAEEPGRLVDTLLVAALIEARSCERFGLLAAALEGPEPALAAFYRGLLESEARHHGEYLRLAESAASREDVRARLAALAEHEARVLAAAPPTPRLHN